MILCHILVENLLRHQCVGQCNQLLVALIDRDLTDLAYPANVVLSNIDLTDLSHEVHDTRCDGVWCVLRNQVIALYPDGDELAHFGQLLVHVQLATVAVYERGRGRLAEGSLVAVLHIVLKLV